MVSERKSLFVVSSLLLFLGLTIGAFWAYFSGAAKRPGPSSAQVRTSIERRINRGGDNRLDAGRENRKIKEKAEIREKAQRDVGRILGGAPIHEFLPEYSGMAKIIFCEELEKGLKVDLSSTGDYGIIKKIFTSLNENGDKHGGLKERLLSFTISLESGTGISNDVSEKIGLYDILNRSDYVMSFSNYLAKIGANKGPGPIDQTVFSAISNENRKALLRGMARSGDLDGITTALGVQEEAERGSLLEFTVNELMKNHPGKTISHIAELQDPVQRTFCLTIAVESLRKAGAMEEAEEWAKVIGE